MALNFNIMQGNNCYPASLMKLGKNNFEIIVNMNDSTYELRFIDNKFSLVDVTNNIDKHYIDIPLSYSFKDLMSIKKDRNTEYYIPLPEKLPFIDDNNLVNADRSINMYMNKKDLIFELVRFNHRKNYISIFDNLSDLIYTRIFASYTIPDAENLIKEILNLMPKPNDLNDYEFNFTIYRFNNLNQDNYQNINLTIVSRDDWYRVINHTNGTEQDFYGMFTNRVSRYLVLDTDRFNNGFASNIIFKGESNKNLLWIPVPGCDNFKIASPIPNENNYVLDRKRNILNIYHHNDNLVQYRMDKNVDEFLNIITNCFEKFEQKQSSFLKFIIKED